MIIFSIVFQVFYCKEIYASSSSEKFLKGRWETASVGLNGYPRNYVYFTKKYVKYGHLKKGKFITDNKVKIKSVKKLKKKVGYKIQLKNGVFYKSNGQDILEYYWKEKGKTNYSGGSSLWRSTE